jgi:hypothetical protein
MKDVKMYFVLSFAWAGQRIQRETGKGLMI